MNAMHAQMQHCTQTVLGSESRATQLNTGNGTFIFTMTGTYSTSETHAVGLALADFDKNGALDVVVASAQGSNFQTWGNSVSQFMGKRIASRIFQAEQTRYINDALVSAAGALRPSSVICGVQVDTIETSQNAKRFHTGMFGLSTFYGLAAQGSNGPPYAEPYLALNGIVPGAAFGDVDNDGDLDLIVSTVSLALASGTYNTVLPHTSIFINDGAGRFDATENNGSLLGVLGFTDADGDGDLDAVDACLRLYVNDGTGGFSTADEARTLWGGDLSLSARPTVSQTAKVYHSGSQVWSQTNSVFEWAGAYAMGDIDGDGDADVLGVGPYTTIFSYKATGSGTYATAVDAHAGSASVSSFYVFDLVLGDVDGDSDLDLVMATINLAAYDAGTANQNMLLLLQNDGSGAFGATNLSPVMTAWQGNEIATHNAGWYRPKNILLADLNNDGHLDLVTPGSYNIAGENQPIAYHTGSSSEPFFAVDSAGQKGNTAPPCQVQGTSCEAQCHLDPARVYLGDGVCQASGSTPNCDTAACCHDLGDCPGTPVTLGNTGQVVCDQPIAFGNGNSPCTGTWTAGDYDNDGDVDLFLSRAFGQNLEWESIVSVLKAKSENTGVSHNAYSHANAFSMASALGDVDTDGGTQGWSNADPEPRLSIA